MVSENPKEYVVAYDLREPKWYRRLRKEICSFGPGSWVQKSVRRFLSALDAPTISSRMQQAAEGTASVLVIEVNSVHEHKQ